jgi:hypothetical protein
MGSKKHLLSSSVYTGLFCMTMMVIVVVSTPVAHADMSQWEKGADISPSYTTELGTAASDQSLANLKAVHANAVSFVIQLYQSDLYSTDIGTGGNTTTDSALIHAIQKAHALGLSVTLKPHIDPRNGGWRAGIDPSDRTTWFKNYGTVLAHYAALAQANGVEELVIGTELIDMSSDTHNSTNTSNWRALIASTRALYSGKLSYAANWGPQNQFDEKNDIAFWDALDFVGIDGYYRLGNNFSETSVSAYLVYWDQWYQNDILKFHQKVNKPIIFTEIGYKSTSGAHLDPGDYNINNGYNAEEQANAYQALFSYWSSVDFLKGMYIWEWKANPSPGGVGDTDYTPQNKLAQNVISQWYGGSGVALVAPKPAVIAATAQVSAPSLTLGQIQTVSATVANTGGQLDGGIVDIEIYDANGGKMFQQFYENQSVQAGATVPYVITWQPAGKGSYTVKIGVFKANWSQTYVWNGTAASFTVGEQTVAKPAFSLQSSLSAASISLGTSEGATIGVQNAGGASQNNIVDIEIYNSANKQMFQKFYDGQSFASNDTKSFHVDWTAQSLDTYHVAVGVFSNGWSQNYVWTDSIATFNVINPQPVVVVPVVPPTPAPTPTTTPITVPVTPTTTPVVAPPVATTTPILPPGTTTVPIVPTTTPPVTPVVPLPPPVVTPPVVIPSGSINVWWPTTNSTIGGTLPFKALVDNTSVDTYDMYWQVDGGSQNWMYSTSQDYPHKETWADVSGWNWRGNGPYTLTFIAKDHNGNIIATKDIIVNISQ